MASSYIQYSRPDSCDQNQMRPPDLEYRLYFYAWLASRGKSLFTEDTDDDEPLTCE